MLRYCALGYLFICLQGCTKVQPWVQAYERGHLADPIMQMDRDPVSTRYMTHVYDTREGARGADGGSGGGCGCN